MRQPRFIQWIIQFFHRMVRAIRQRACMVFLNHLRDAGVDNFVEWLQSGVLHPPKDVAKVLELNRHLRVTQWAIVNLRRGADDPFNHGELAKRRNQSNLSHQQAVEELRQIHKMMHAIELWAAEAKQSVDVG